MEGRLINMKLFTKLLLAFSIIVALFIGLTVYSISQSMNKDIHEHTSEVKTLAEETLQSVHDSRTATETQLGSNEEITSASQALTNLSEDLQKAIGQFNTK